MKDSKGRTRHQAGFGAAGREVTREMAEEAIRHAKQSLEENGPEGAWWAPASITYHENIIRELDQREQED